MHKRSFARPLLRCVTPEEGKKILEELNEGACNAHTEGRTLAVTAIQTGYYWPSMREDTMTLVRTCDKWQKFAPIQRVPSTPMTLIVSLYHSLLGVWTSSDLSLKQRGSTSMSLWQSTISPNGRTSSLALAFRAIIFDNGRQFSTTKLIDYLGTLARFTTVSHPQTDGQAEAVNKSILHSLQKKLDDAKGKWVDELHSVLCSIGTTKKMAINESPFILAYGSKSFLLIEVVLHTHPLTTFQEELNNAALQEALDLLPSVHGDALLRAALYKLRIMRVHDRIVRLQPF